MMSSLHKTPPQSLFQCNDVNCKAVMLEVLIRPIIHLEQIEQLQFCLYQYRKRNFELPFKLS